MHQFPLLNLPFELVDEIVLSIPARKEIVALSLTCQFFKGLLVRDIDYCEVGASIVAEHLWDHFIANPALAKRVRSLYVGDSPSRSKFPSSYILVSTGYYWSGEKMEEKLSSAIRVMSSLASFQWDHSFVPYPQLWPALHCCTKLREIDILDTLPSPRDDLHRENDVSDQQVFSFPNLTALKLRTIISPSIKATPYTLNTSTFLPCSRNLSVLSLNYHSRQASPCITDLFSKATWPALHTLELSFISCDPIVVNSFLARHPHISTMRIRDRPTARFSLSQVQPSSIPNLATFKGQVHALLELSHAHPPLATYELRVADLLVQGFTEQAAFAKTLKGLEVTLKVVKLARSMDKCDDEEAAVWFSDVLPNARVECRRSNPEESNSSLLVTR
ncbi:hypothetical protein JAAARDRAFT_691747 [Jaapia argillacea MUCL 33604]|uniref:F-box domain-containing protein n=1 Tax=Jaapia argillacea MUCL 33604 TaxID=933084 RepID=A0A067PZF6_9AGAM|nr:hypothetical protein JAAARDRAFT_691747 [Jaapia argillacea MUCL 33604]